MQFYAKDIMSESVITVRPEMTTDEVAQVFAMNRITGAPVVDANGVLIGVITAHDILNAEMSAPYITDYFSQALAEGRFDESGFHIEAASGFVTDYMNRHIYTALPDTPVEELARMMYHHRIHRIIILKPNEQRPVGVVTTFDLLKLMADISSTAELRG